MHASIADVIADTAQNSIEAGAGHVSVTLTERLGRISIEICDNGKGMDEQTAAKAFDPFYTEPGKHDKRKVGLGLPILRQICEATGGSVELESKKGVGTTLKYDFDASHIDLPPMGDITVMVTALFNYPGDFEMVFTHAKGDNRYSIAKSELIDAVGPLDGIEALSLAREFISSQESELSAS